VIKAADLKGTEKLTTKMLRAARLISERYGIQLNGAVLSSGSVSKTIQS
jgi:hypothetical protein